jgi:hypothetical protein
MGLIIIAANSDPSLEQRMKALETDVAFLRLSRFESLSHVAVYNMIEERYGLIDDSRVCFVYLLPII